MSGLKPLARLVQGNLPTAQSRLRVSHSTSRNTTTGPLNMEIHQFPVYPNLLYTLYVGVGGEHPT
jgi:hypothetical protein